ncbi:MAG: bifunctional adenosylcobinamide kinase/adenosylcobinamide-phosphate guanylyltransferase [Clostridiales bacterium]|nr:bifunctional adenosylcobinamide kinase/adenosylcobinamide-phosphate guanylyltransferase [Clostridiales bacterium]
MLILVTGGSGSGKSAYAEERAVLFPAKRRIYVATMYPYDLESRHRVDRHRRMRWGKDFETVECYTHLDELYLPRDCTVLLECMSNLVANEMFMEGGAGERAEEEILEGIRQLRSQVRDMVIVTNEICSDGCLYERETVRYQEVLGHINQKLARIADEVAEVVYGIPLILKGGGANEEPLEQL